MRTCLTLCLTLTLAVTLSWSSVPDEVPCVVPEGHTDPEIITADIDEPVGGVRCQQYEFVQELHRRCEPRLCCKEKCSCADPDTLEREDSTACPSDRRISNPVIYNCYVENVVIRSHKYVCCEGYEEDKNDICVEKISCARNNGGCMHQCVEVNGVDTCICNPGYQVLNRTLCQDINECEDPKLNYCGIHGCLNTMGSFRCQCLPGYLLLGNTCKDIDECAEGLDTCHMDCTNTQGSYKCSCPSGYTLLPDGSCADGVPIHPGAAPRSEETQNQPSTTPPYVYIIPIVAAILIFLIILLLLLRRRRRQKKINSSLSNIAVSTPAFDNAAYDEVEGAVGVNHDYEELPPVKKAYPDEGDQAAPLPTKVPMFGAPDGHYEDLPCGKAEAEKARAENHYVDGPTTKAAMHMESHYEDMTGEKGKVGGIEKHYEDMNGAKGGEKPVKCTGASEGYYQNVTADHNHYDVPQGLKTSQQ